LETWPLRDFGLRAGANLYDLAVGGSYSFREQDVELQLDYAFCYPMPFVQESITDTMGSHRFSLALKFDHLLQLMKVKKAEPQLEPALQDALSYQKAGDYNAAIAAYQEVLKQNDTNQEAHFLLAELYAELKRYEEAIPHYTSAIELAPNEPRFHYALGSLYEQYGDDTGDKNWYNKAMIAFTKTRMLDANYKNVSSKLKQLRQKEL
jgi:tetratricopeptide (TPR) repeat protein